MAHPDSTSGIKLRGDGKQVIVELTKVQVNPGGYPISIYGDSSFLPHGACKIYGYDGGLEFSRLNTSNVVHEIKAWSIKLDSTKGMYYFDGLFNRWTVT